MNDNRYTVPEDENYETGSNNSVLKNLLKIKKGYKDYINAIHEGFCGEYKK